MPLSADNPNRNRNFVILILGGTVALAIVMGSYVALDIAGSDTDSFVRFLTLLTVTLIPATLGAWRAHVAADRAGEAVVQGKAAVQQVEAVQEKLNGGLEQRITGATHDALDQRGAPGQRPPAPAQSEGPVDL